MIKLRQLNAELQARNQDLGAFDYTVAHDLKGPLEPHRRLCRAAERRPGKSSSNSRQKERYYLQKIAKNGRKMGNIIDELLLLAGVRKTEVKMRPLDMATIVADARDA